MEKHIAVNEEQKYWSCSSDPKVHFFYSLSKRESVFLVSVVRHNCLLKCWKWEARLESRMVNVNAM